MHEIHELPRTGTGLMIADPSATAPQRASIVSLTVAGCRRLVRFLFTCLLMALPIHGIASPNVVIVVLDDMAVSEIDFMPRSVAFLRTHGVEFVNAHVSNSLCCPSRATFLSGKYSQNTGVFNNSGAKGGFDAFYSLGGESQTIGTWFAERGYYTGFVGKYLNGYGWSTLVPSNHVPPGWSEWYALASSVSYYGYKLVENGAVRRYGFDPSDYATDVMSERARQFLSNAMAGHLPFLLYFSPLAPHADTKLSPEDDAYGLPVAAPRHQDLFAGVSAPRSASFNEADVTDKPNSTRKLPLMSPTDIEWIDRSYRVRLQSLQAVDEAFESLLMLLAGGGVLDNTIIAFTSDNGVFFGDHRRVSGKGPMYGAVSRVPLFIAGPRVVQGLRRHEVIGNMDLFPTISDLAGLGTPDYADGRSFKMAIKHSWRNYSGRRTSMLLIQGLNGTGIRLPSYAYYETYGTDGKVIFRELYDLLLDPGERENIVASLTPESLVALTDSLSQLRSCARQQCRTLEDGLTDGIVRRVRK